MDILNLEDLNTVIFAMAGLAESRDREAGAHLERVRRYCRLLAIEASHDPALASRISPRLIDLIYHTCPLHDIGKSAIPDSVLLKPGLLDDREFEIMKTHTTLGAATLDRALRQRPGAEYLRVARNIAAAHHERFDGHGYPAGLKGEDIPLCARLFAVADVYDALVSKRVYKDAFSHEVSKNIILCGAGTQFDPRIVEAFGRCEEAFRVVGQQFANPACGAADEAA